MKNFEMPIVAMNEMAMNESIASDCCYCYTTSGFNRYFNVLNGGSVDKVTSYYWKANIVSAFGVDKFTGIISPCVHYYRIKEDENNVLGGAYASYPSITAAEKEYWIPASAAEVAAGPMGGTYEYKYATGICSHTSTSGCPWLSSGGTVGYQHRGATTAHALGGLQWATAHTAYQYNS